MRKVSYLIMLLIISITASSCAAENRDTPPTAVNGIIDLRGLDFEECGSVSLDGEWEFYRNELLSPKDFTEGILKSRQLEIVPSLWSRYGYATYRLKLKLDNHDKIYALKMGEVYTAYRIWVNGQEVFSCGKTGKNKAESIPNLIPHTTQFAVDSNELEIIIQISNFFYKDGGIKDPVEFGAGSKMAIAREKTMIANYTLFGSLLIMGLYHLGLFFLRKESSSALYFSFFCLIIASRILVTNENFIVHIFPDISWFLRIKIIVLGYYLTLPVFSTFLYKLFKNDLHKIVIRIIQAAGTAASLFVLFTPASIFVYTEVVIQIIILISLLYIIVILTVAAFKKREGAALIIIGVLCMFITAVNDILYAQHIPYALGQNLLPYGMLIFILIQSYILSVHFARAFEHASIDELSQVYNRRKFLELAQLEIEKAEKKEKPLCLLSIDVDHFKSVNDTYGHDAGDLVLKTIADAFMNSIRKFDIFGRMGGEEFALLLPETDKELAIQIAERLHGIIRSLSIPVAGETIKITVSIGLAQLSPAQEIDAFLKQTDVALYKAKNNGRNRTES